MIESNVDQMYLIEGDGFWGNFCTTVDLLNAGVGTLAYFGVIELVTAATGGLAGALWAGTALGCAIFITS